MSFGWLLVKTLLALSVILGMIVLLFRYIVPRIQGSHAPGNSRIRIIDRIGLEPRKILYMVKVGKKHMLLGTSEQGVHKLADLDPADWEEKV